MSYPFVQAKHYTSGAMIEPRAVIWHMAEGGGTVGYFESTTRNVSSHFVVERTGRIVQMVRETDASHCQAPTLVESAFTPASNSGIYSFADAVAVLGADGVKDINRYAFAVEVEGYAADGPSITQMYAMEALAADLRARHATLRGALGHRDVTEMKPCPGAHMPWERLGGHGRWFAGGEPMIVAKGFNRSSDMVVFVKQGTQFYKSPGGAPLVKMARDSDVEYFGLADGWLAVEISTSAVSCDGVTPCPVICYVPPGTGVPRAKPVPPPPVDETPYSQADIDAAVAADREGARIVWG